MRRDISKSTVAIGVAMQAPPLATRADIPCSESQRLWLCRGLGRRFDFELHHRAREVEL
jgi:hypothetical protein